MLLYTILANLGAFAATLAPAVTATLSKFAIVTLAIIGTTLFVAGSVYVSLIIDRFLARRSGNVDKENAVDERLGAFVASLSIPAITLYDTIRRFSTQFLLLIVSNWRFVAMAIFVAGISALWYFYPVILTAFGGLWIPFAAVWRFLLHIVTLARVIFNMVYVLVNFIVIRVPGAFATGIVFDQVACSRDAIILFVRGTTDFAFEFATALATWTASGSDALVVSPDFGPAALALGSAIGSLASFFTCTCYSGSGVFTPIFLAADQGPPAPYEPYGLPPFSSGINATLALPFVVLADFPVRPIVLIVQGVQQNKTFFEVLRGAHLSFNGTLDTSMNLFNGSLGVFTNLVQQYWVAIGRATTGGVVPGVDFIAPPPVIFECVTPLIRRKFTLYNSVANAFFRFQETFTTFNGRRNLSVTEYFNLARVFVDCICQLIEWLADLLRFIGSEIQSTCTSSLDCDNPSPCVARKDYGRCATNNGSVFHACSSDADCTTVDNFCLGATSCANNHSSLVIPCSFGAPIIPYAPCQRCLFDVGTCSSGAPCDRFGDSSECNGTGLCMNNTCAIVDALNQTLPVYLRTCEVDSDCDICFVAPAQCSGACDDLGGADIGADIGGCVFSVVGGLLDIACCLIRNVVEIILRSFEFATDFVFGMIYTIVFRTIDAKTPLCIVPNATYTEYCDVPITTFVFFDYFSYMTGNRRTSLGINECPAEICLYPACTSDIQCTTQGSSGYDMVLYDVAPHCDLRFNRCVHTPSSCSSSGPAIPMVGCVDNSSNICTLSSCNGTTCPSGPDIVIFNCDCECSFDQARSLFLYITELGVCLGDSFLQTWGVTAAPTRCGFIHFFAFIAESLDFFVDFISQIGLVFRTPSAVTSSTIAFERVIKGFGECAKLSVTSVQSISMTPSLASAATDGFLLTAIDIIVCIVNSVIAIAKGIFNIITGLWKWIIEGIAPDIIEQAIMAVFTFIMYFFALVAYIFAAIFYALSIPINAFLAIADAFSDAGTFIKMSTPDVIAAILDIIEFLGACIASVGEFIFGLFACLGQLAIGGTCGNVFEPLLPCATAIWALLMQLFAFISGTVTCFLREVECFFNTGNEFEDLCPSVNATYCDSLNLFCGIEDAVCLFGFTVDLGCAGHPPGPCALDTFVCDLFTGLCALEIFLKINVGFAFPDPMPGTFFPPQPATNWPAVVRSTMLGGFLTVPATCCQLPAPNTLPSLFNNNCWNNRFLRGDRPSAMNDQCFINLKEGCFFYLSDCQVYSLQFRDCCQTPASLRTAPVTGCPMGIECLIGMKKRSPLLLADNETYDYSMLEKRTAEETMAMLPTSMIVERFMESDNGLVRRCASYINGYIDDNTVVWPPMEQIVANTQTTITRYLAASCMSYLNTQEVQIRLYDGTLVPEENRTLGHTILSLATNSWTTTMAWAVTYNVEGLGNTLRLLIEYGKAETLAPQSTVLGIIGTPSMQLLPEYCTPGILPSAIIADLLTPTVGSLFRVFIGSMKLAAREELAERNGAPPRRELVALRSLVDKSATLSSMFLQPAVLAGLGTGITELASAGSAHMKRATHVLAIDNMMSITRTTRNLLTQPRTPEMALYQYPNEAYAIAMRKRSVPSSGHSIASWVEETSTRIDNRVTTLMRRALFGTDDMDAITLMLAAIDNSTCDLRASPFTCCPGQVLCTNCSTLDRTAWSLQNGADNVARYYRTDFVQRDLPCARRALDSDNGNIVPFAEKCPQAFCDAAECDTDDDCAQYVVGPPQAGTCNPTLKRCIIESDSGCVNIGDKCFEPTNSSCSLGTCTGTGTCSPTITFSCNCQCPDTFVTRTKRTPWIFDRLFNLKVPCLLNITCFLESIVDTSTNFTAPPVHKHTGAWAAGNTNSSNGLFVTSTDALTNGRGSEFISFIEDVVYSIETIGNDTTVYENALHEYLFCDYDADWFCPLISTPPSDCCSDLCEERRQGTSLFDGLVFTFLIMVVPLAVVSIIGVNFGFELVWTRCVLLIAAPLVMMLAYGGGLLCYTVGPFRLLIFIIPLLTSLTIFIVRACCFVPRQLAKFGFEAGPISCPFQFPDCSECTAVLTTVIGIISPLLIFLAYLPALPSCFGGDAYALLSETIPPCFPLVPRALVNISLLDPTMPCAYNIPPIAQCRTPGFLVDTQFNDGIDHILYIAERIEPGFSDSIKNSTLPLLSSLAPYAQYHTTAAHASAGDRTEACFYITLPDLIWGLFLLFFQTFAELLALAIYTTVLLYSIYSFYLASGVIASSIASFVGDDEPTPKAFKKE